MDLVHILLDLSLNISLWGDANVNGIVSLISNTTCLDFPGGTVVKNPPANVGDTGSRPGLGRSHMPRSS